MKLFRPTFPGCPNSTPTSSTTMRGKDSTPHMPMRPNQFAPVKTAAKCLRLAPAEDRLGPTRTRCPAWLNQGKIFFPNRYRADHIFQFIAIFPALRTNGQMVLNFTLLRLRQRIASWRAAQWSADAGGRRLRTISYRFIPFRVRNVQLHFHFRSQLINIRGGEKRFKTRNEHTKTRINSEGNGRSLGRLLR